MDLYRKDNLQSDRGLINNKIEFGSTQINSIFFKAGSKSLDLFKTGRVLVLLSYQVVPNELIAMAQRYKEFQIRKEIGKDIQRPQSKTSK